jgi:Zn finger protein HypA/HybF involved in hydrogenase expression
MTNQKLSAIVDLLKTQHSKRDSVCIVVGELQADESIIRNEWAELTSATSLQDARLKIRIIPAEQQCMWCFLVYRPIKGETQCPQCRSVGAKIIHGEEFYLDEE